MTAQAVAVTAAPAAAGSRRRAWRWSVAGLAALAALLTLWASWSQPVVDYYAAAAVSMGHSWSNFLLGALDPAGTITVDKIPGALWIPALLVRVFGYSPAAVLVPDALAAVAAVVVVAVTARRLAGPTAGIVAGAVAVTTPIVVAAGRSNQPESFFILALACTAWASVHAVQRRSVRWLSVAGVFVAAGFQVYMLVAWAVWPALAAAYLCTRQSWARRILHVLAAGLASLALSLAWVLTVWLMPVGSRPYLGSTVHDNPWELVFGYNGLGRFGAATATPRAYNSYTPPFVGAPGPLRLFDAQLAGQIGWLLPAAAAAVVVLLVLRAPVWMPVLLGGWMLTFGTLFSVVAGMHEFYTAALAVPVALAVGAAYGRARRSRAVWAEGVLLAACAVTALGVAAIYGGPSLTIALIQAAVAAFAVAVALRRRRPRVVTAMALAAMLLTPAAWSASTWGGVAAGDPVAGAGLSDARIAPVAAVAPASAPGSRRSTSDGATGARPRTVAAFAAPADDTALLRYVRARTGAARYTMAVFGADRAAVLIVQSQGQSVLPVGGYSGADPVPTLEAFTAMVQAGDVQYVQVPVTGVPAPATATQAQRILSWVTDNCRIDMQAPAAGVYACGRR